MVHAVQAKHFAKISRASEARACADICRVMHTRARGCSMRRCVLNYSFVTFATWQYELRNDVTS